MRSALLFCCILAFGATGCTNFHPVIEGELYRSGQMSTGELRETIQSHGIRTVINLRGRKAHKPWYHPEKALCGSLGVRHLDARFSTQRPPHPYEVRRLIRAFKVAEAPILVHCYGGADRSGFAAGIYLLMKKNATPEEALDQLTILYGHLPWRAQDLDAFLERYQREANGRDFETWFEQEIEKPARETVPESADRSSHPPSESDP